MRTGGPGVSLPARRAQADPVCVRGAQAAGACAARLGAADHRLRHDARGHCPRSPRPRPRVLGRRARRTSTSLIGYPGGCARRRARRPAGGLPDRRGCRPRPATSRTSASRLAPPLRRGERAHGRPVRALPEPEGDRGLLEGPGLERPRAGLYRSLGFRLAGVRRGYYRAPDEDAVLMRCPVPPAGASAPLSRDFPEQVVAAGAPGVRPPPQPVPACVRRFCALRAGTGDFSCRG